jgi:colanic acid biosynthesis glycosyl transferase WcaI
MPSRCGGYRSAVRPRLLVLNQYYWPGVESTAQLLAELCEALVDDFDVTVVTGRLRGRANLPTREQRNGVTILRVESTARDRSHLGSRALNYLTYLLFALRTGLAQRRPDIVVCGTDPPIVGDIELVIARRFRAPLVVISEDVFPEIAVAVGRLSRTPLVSLLQALVRLYLRNAVRVVAIGDTMAQRLQEKGTPRERIRVIPNWTDVSAIRPQPKANEWSLEQKVADRFVVMHSGNVGHAQDLDSLLRATTLVRDLEDLRVLLIGSGARWQELYDLAQTLEADHVQFLDFQPRERLAQTLSSADVHVVGLARGLAGYVVPSRIYSILAAGRPVIAATEEESETAAIVREARCGLVVKPGDPLALARAIRDCHDGVHPLLEMGLRAREFAEREADRLIAFDRYRSVLAEARASSSRAE